MNAKLDLAFGIITGFVSLFLFYDGWIVLCHKKKILYLSLRIQLWFTKLFQGENIAEQIRKKKTSSEAMYSYAIESLVLGFIVFVVSIILVIDAWSRLQIQ